MKPSVFDISFDNPERAYFAGQEVSGKVSSPGQDQLQITLELEEETLISELLLELKGRAKTYWSKHGGKSKTHYSQSEPYFCEQLNTKYTHSFGRPGSSSVGPRRPAHPLQERLVPRGRHQVPFSYTLPKALPTTFEGEFGFVRYTCKATCERPWDFDITTVCPFTVVGVEDINHDSEVAS